MVCLRLGPCRPDRREGREGRGVAPPYHRKERDLHLQGRRDPPSQPSPTIGRRKTPVSRRAMGVGERPRLDRGGADASQGLPAFPRQRPASGASIEAHSVRTATLAAIPLNAACRASGFPSGAFLSAATPAASGPPLRMTRPVSKRDQDGVDQRMECATCGRRLTAP